MSLSKCPIVHMVVTQKSLISMAMLTQSACGCVAGLCVSSPVKTSMNKNIRHWTTRHQNRKAWTGRLHEVQQLDCKSLRDTKPNAMIIMADLMVSAKSKNCIRIHQTSQTPGNFLRKVPYDYLPSEYKQPLFRALFLLYTYAPLPSPPKSVPCGTCINGKMGGFLCFRVHPRWLRIRCWFFGPRRLWAIWWSSLHRGSWRG